MTPGDASEPGIVASGIPARGPSTGLVSASSPPPKPDLGSVGVEVGRGVVIILDLGVGIDGTDPLSLNSVVMSPILKGLLPEAGKDDSGVINP